MQINEFEHPTVEAAQTSATKAAAAMYVIYHTIMAAGPAIFYWLVVQPVVSEWADDFNKLYRKSWSLLWIGNIVIYGVSWILSFFSFIGDPSSGIGIAYWWISILSPVWFGQFWQGIVWIVYLVGTIKFEGTEGGSFWEEKKGAWTAFGGWSGIMILTYLGYWLQDTDFGLYYGNQLF